MSTMLDELKARGLIDAISHEEIVELLQTPQKIYAGFDPTADSLHLGNLLCIVMLRWFQKFGHTPVVLLGGGTGKIGDPSGKSIERPLLEEQELANNVSKIQRHFEQCLDFQDQKSKPILLNNNEWLVKIDLLSFLRDIGKHCRLSTMLAKESVKSRLHSEEGISYTEFTYQILQAYDFYYLHKHNKVTIQIGGSDQWGNITAGIELTRKLMGKTVFGITFPLLTKSDGKKFGKSEEGAIWLSKDKCSPYMLYQYLYKVSDVDVIKLLKMLTFLDLQEIQELEQSMHQKQYVPNTTQKRLAEEVTRFVHGEEGLQAAQKATEAAKPGSKATLDVKTLKQVVQDLPHYTLPKQEVIGKKYTEIMAETGLLASKGEGVRLIKNQGAYLNDQKIQDVSYVLSKEDCIGDQYLILGAGKKKKMVLILSDE